MAEFQFYYPIQVRYGDLDPQWHVNNSRFLTFMEQARFEYLIQRNLWDGVDFFKLGMIVADAHIIFKAPILLGQKIRIGARVSRLGNKSMLFVYSIEDSDTGQVMGSGETVMVYYNYLTHQSETIPDEWRQKISDFEGIPSRS
jgi:acyl-CoA thioester hydrolase